MKKTFVSKIRFSSEIDRVSTLVVREAVFMLTMSLQRQLIDERVIDISLPTFALKTELAEPDDAEFADTTLEVTYTVTYKD